jgi:anti-sigma B factor antagonist
MNRGASRKPFPISISQSQLNAATVLTLSGRLDGLASPILDQKVDALVASGVRSVVFDCSGLAYVSSAGLRSFLTAAKKLKTASGKASFAALAPAVHGVFELSGFLTVLEVHPTVASAAA